MNASHVSDETIVNVAKNARLRLSAVEQKAMVKDCREVLEAFALLDELDVSREKPAFQPIALQNVFRKDVPEKCLDTPAALANAAHKKPPYFLGPEALQ